MSSKNNHRWFYKLIQHHFSHHYHLNHPHQHRHRHRHRFYRSIMLNRLIMILLILMYSIILMAQSRTLVNEPSSSSNTNYFRNLLSNGIGFNKTILFEREEVTSDIVKILRENPDQLLTNRTDDLKLISK